MTEIKENPDFKITTLKNVRISNNSVVFSYFKIFKESCIGEEVYKKYSKGFKFFLKFIFPQPNFSKKKFLLITDEWTSNYYHWHIFALPKLLALKESNLIEGSRLLLPKKYLRYQFILPSLKKFGIDPKQIVYLRRKSNIKVAKLPLVELLKGSSSSFAKITKILTSNIAQKDFGFGEKIYISREGQVLRFIENEQETVKLLEQYGFKKIIIDKFPYEDQIAICSQAKYLVSSHGAGLTNMLFMPQGSSILELATYHDPAKITHYESLSSLTNMNYIRQECAIGERSQVKDFHHASLVVDLVELEKNLKKMLEKLTEIL